MRTSRLGAAFAAPLYAVLLYAFAAWPCAAAAADFARPFSPPAAKVAEPAPSLRAAPGSLPGRSLRLDLVDTAAIAAAKHANSVSGTKRLQIGVGREVPPSPEAASAALLWARVPGGIAAHWQVTSPAAAALRVGLAVRRFPQAAEIRFAGFGGRGAVYGPLTAADLPGGDRVHWSPVLEGESALIEIFLADETSPREVELAIAQVSHLFASPADARAERQAKDGSQFCEVDLVCRSATDAALAEIGRAVARMTFTDGAATYLCTGTLLASSGANPPPYFYSANHCISTQSVATTLTTHWFYDRAGCGSGTTSASYRQLTGGATILYGNATTDVTFMRLNATPPAGAVYAGWSSVALSAGTPLTAVHHPAGDWKKVSLGSAGGFSAYGGAAGTTHIVALWNSVATGVTEGGSSGSGIFTAVGSPASFYALRGGLHGGPSSCTASGTGLRDYYSRFDQAYPSIATYLNPASCTYALSSTSHSLGSGNSGGLFTMTTQPGCTWSATASANWIFPSADNSSTMTGNRGGLVTYFASYQVTQNTGGARTGKIALGGQEFTVNQAAAGSPCTYSVNSPWSGLPGDREMTNAIGVNITPGCAWTARSNDGWLTTSSSGVGSGYVYYTAASNMTGSVIGPQRIGTISVGDQTIFVYQSGDIASSYNRLTNISTRGLVLAGDSVMIGGFVIGGSSSKTVLVRARGPSLSAAGVAGAMANPRLTLVDQAAFTVIATNDDFGMAPNLTAIQATGNAPTSALESAILISLNPGAYTAIVDGSGGGTGVGIVEVFEVDRPDVPLVNISTRGLVLTGDSVMIGGFVIGGTAPKTVLVRARGPSLAAAGVAGAMVNPRLTLVDQATFTVVGTNDDFGTAANLTAIQATGNAPTNALESAILITLNPGAYTAIVDGVGGGTGVGIVEVFAQ